jgi:hypothetical protein
LSTCGRKRLEQVVIQEQRLQADEEADLRRQGGESVVAKVKLFETLGGGGAGVGKD